MRKPSSSAAARSASVIELDALDRDRRGVDLGAEGKRGKDRELVGGVEAADVEGWIRLRVAKPLRLGEADLERQLLGLHARQNIVAGAVENAGDALDRVSRQTFAQGLDDRYPAADRGFVVEWSLVGFREVGELQAVRGEHRLVGGDDGQTARERRLDRLESCSIPSADQFDEDVDIRRRRHQSGVFEKLCLFETGRGVALAADAVSSEHAVTAGSRDELGPSPLQQLNEAGPDHAETRDAETQRLFHGFLAPPSETLTDATIRRSCGRGISEAWALVQPYRSEADLFFFLRSLRAA